MNYKKNCYLDSEAKETNFYLKSHHLKYYKKKNRMYY